MDIFSYAFFVLWAAGILLYYIIAKHNQWLVLLILSLIFYGYALTKVPVVLITVSILTYAAALWITDMDKIPRHFEKMTRGGVKWFISCICIGLLFISSASDWFFKLGNSYFTLKAISYLHDAERDERNCERNFLFYLLYLIYLPTILQGPFNRFAQFKESLLKKIDFDYVGFMHGVQRFLWGAFKKLVLAARLNQISVFVSDGWENKSGLAILLGVVSYSLWFYMDFSSYMDMMLGVSGTFGIDLPENFRQPFFAKSIAEFWRRWHITLGGIFRDYLMIPFVQSKQGRALRKHFKKYGKNTGRLASVLMGTLIVWIATALWHGRGWNYLVWGMYYCMIISISLVLESVYGMVRRELRIAEGSKGYEIFGIVRTWGLVLVANLILQVNGFREFFLVMDRMAGRSFFVGEYLNLSALGWIWQDVVVLVTGLLILLLVSITKEKNINVFDMLDKCILPVRWTVYYALLFAILLFGMYGSQYDAGQFLYMQF